MCANISQKITKLSKKENTTWTLPATIKKKKKIQLQTIDVLFVCPLPFYTCSISPDSKGTNSHWQKFWFLLASLQLQDQEFEDNLCWYIWQLFGLYLSDDDRPECHDHIYPRQFPETVTNLPLNGIVPNRHWYSNHFQCIPLRVLDIFPTLMLGPNILFYPLAIHIPDNSHVYLPFFRMS